MGVVKQAVEHGGRDRFVGHGFCPPRKGFVRRHDDRPRFVSGADELKEQVGLLLTQAVVPHFIDDEDMRFLEPGQFALEPVLLLGPHQFLDEVRAGRVVRRVAAQASLIGEPDEEMGLPQARRTEEDDVLLPFDEAERLELGELGRRQASLDPGKVEVIEPLVHREPGKLHPALDGALLPRDVLDIEEGGNKVKEAPLLFRLVGEEGFEAGRHEREAHVFHARLDGFELDVHDAPPEKSLS